MTTLTTYDLDWIFFGFRLGQLSDACNSKGRVEEDDDELIANLIDNLAIAALSCIASSGQQALVCAGISEMKTNWKNRDSLARKYADRPFELIYGACLRLPATVRQVTKSVREVTAFEVGTELGQSSGYCMAFFDGRDSNETCWHYRNQSCLTAKLTALGETLDRLTGIPDTNGKELLKFISTLPYNSVKMERYPQRRWGWALIEDRLMELRPTLPTPPIPCDEPDKLSGQTDTREISQKKSKRRSLDKHAWACIKEYRGYKKRRDPQSMKDIVRNYVQENKGVSESTLYKRLNDNNDQWKK